MQQHKTGIKVKVMVAMAVTWGMLVTGVQAQSGSLEPPSTAVDSAANPAPTTQTQPSWDQALPAAERFVPVMGGAAVLDKETGLVWEQSPQTTMHSWSAARIECLARTVGNQKGWRLPSVHELASLVDPTNPDGNPDLPSSHPFSNVQSATYWTATRVLRRPDPPNEEWVVDFEAGNVGRDDGPDRLVWCVRGGGPLTKY